MGSVIVVDRLSCLRNLPRPGIEPMSSALAVWFLTTWPPWKSNQHWSFDSTCIKGFVEKWPYCHFILSTCVLMWSISNVCHGTGNGTPLQYSCLENPWMEEPGRLQSMGSLRVGHDWATSLSLFTFMHWRRKWQPTPVFLPRESQGWGSLVGCRLWGCTESDTTEVT